MEFVKFCRERQRMCASFPMEGDQHKNCPLYELTQCTLCEAACLRHCHKAENIVFEWAVNNPITTNMDMLAKVIGETFPNMKVGMKNGNLVLLNKHHPYNFVSWAESEYKGGGK